MPLSWLLDLHIHALCLLAETSCAGEKMCMANWGLESDLYYGCKVLAGS